jgi:TsgA-like MFS transporter
MTANTFRLTFLSVLISLTLGAHNGQLGLLIKPISEFFGVSITAAAAQFSWLNGGILFGNVVAIGFFRFFKMRWIVAVCNLALAVAAVFIFMTTSFRALAPLFFSTGIALGVGVCAASTILTHIWNEQQRQSALVAQDAFFNGGGMIFPYLLGLLLVQQFSWGWGFLSMGIVAVVIVGLSMFSRFDFETKSQNDKGAGIEWAPGLVVAGISMFLIIISQISVIIWLPTFLEERFEVSSIVSAGVIAQIYIAALIGSIVSTVVVAKVSIQRFLIVIVSIGCVSIFLFTLVPTIGWATVNAYVFGLAIAALYHSFIAWGLSYIRKPGYAEVTFLYICAGVSGTLTPYVSSKVVEDFSISTTFLGCSAAYGAILILMLALNSYSRRRA